jgi:hypothetical protein
MAHSRRRLRRSMPGLLIATVMALLIPLLPAAAAAPLPAAGDKGINADTDIYIRDYVGDAGVEPHANSVWTSPDIKVCPTPVECAVSQNPEVGSTNYIFVKLNSPGPYGSGADIGNLDVLRSTPGGGTAWPGDWTSIGGILGQPVAAVGTTTAMIEWVDVPGPGHFCLLARWESADDPMSFPEGPNTVLNTQQNNNIAWRNVNSVDLFYDQPQVRPYAIGNPGRERIFTDLAINDPNNRFREYGGRLIVDLGGEVYSRWREGGGRATGVRQVGQTSFEVFDFKSARFYGILLDPGTRPEVQLQFSVAPNAPRSRHVIRVNQFAPLEQADKPTDVGGVEYQVTIG